MVPRRLAREFKELVKNHASPSYQKEIGSLMKRRPAKVSDREMNRVLAVMKKTPSMRASKKKTAGQKKSKPRSRKVAAAPAPAPAQPSGKESSVRA